MNNVALLDLVRPYVLRGENFGPQHAALSALRVVGYETATDALGTTIRGRCEFDGYFRLNPLAGGLSITAGVDEAAPGYDPAKRTPVFDIAETAVEFELFVPRQGSPLVATGVAGLGAPAAFQAVQAVLDALAQPAPGTPPSDYPATGFTLDLILDAPTVRPPFLHPAKLSPLGVLAPDPTQTEVAITLPRLRFRLSQTGDASPTLRFELQSFGTTGLDDPGDEGVAELISMTPPYAYIGGQNDQVVGIGFRSATLDISDEYTPAALRDKTGVGDDFTGLYLPEVRVFVSPSGQRDFAFEAGARELLIGLGSTSGIWGDFEALLVDQGSGSLHLGARFVDAAGTVLGIERTDERSAVARLPELTRLVIDVEGGRRPYTRTLSIDGGASQTGEAFSVDLSPASVPSGTATLTVVVTDSSATPVVSTLTIEAQLRTAPELLAVPGPQKSPAQPAVPSAASGEIVPVIATQNDSTVVLQTDPVDADTRWSVDGGAEVGPQSTLTVTVAAGTSHVVRARQPGATFPQPAPFFYTFDEPDVVTANPDVATTMAVSKDGTLREVGGVDSMAANKPVFEAMTAGAAIDIIGYASHEGNEGKLTLNFLLAKRRAASLQRAIEAAYPAKGFQITVFPGDGDTESDWKTKTDWTPATHAAPNDRKWWLATASLPAPPPRPEQVGQVTLTRPATKVPPPVIPPVDPQPVTPHPPGWLRSASLKLRLVRSELIALEIACEIDFQALSDDRLASTGQLNSATTSNPDPADSLVPPKARALRQGEPIGADNPADGIVLMRILCQTDPATGRTMTLMSVGADPADKDGLILFGWMPGDPGLPNDEDVPIPKSFTRTLLGSYLSFWPMLAEFPPVDAAQSALDGAPGAVVDAVLAGAVMAVPGVIAALPWLQVERVVVFGAEYQQTTGTAEFDARILLDVGIDWSANLLDLITINPHHPLSVRYKAIGIRLGNRLDDGTDAWRLRPIFDSSRGYTIDVASGGSLKIKEPLGQILKILGARLSKTNPLTLEIDIGLGVDLGVVSIDRAGLRAYLSEPRPPELTALGATVDIPGALVGSGFVKIGHQTDAQGAEISVIAGQLDLTLRPISLRIAAAVAIATIPAVPGQHGEATGVYVGLNVVLPVGIPLGTSGLGIFGFRGIFGMHYHRNPAIGQGSGVPALEWLKASGGQPHLLSHNGVDLWTPEIDTWSFGVGMLVGTMEGGVIMNLDGTLLLELPGPRILLMMNARILSPPPSLDGLGSSGGVLAVLEITPEHLLIGILVSWEIEDLITIVIPIEAMFPFPPHADEWHIYLGARPDLGAPVEVNVLGIVKGTGYLVFKGDGLAKYQARKAELPAIEGFAIGLGLAASFVWGSTAVGLYLRIGGGMDAVLAFDPFILGGTIWVAGELRLFIVSIGADAQLTVVVCDNGAGGLDLSVKGEVCGHVSFLFFEVEGCVDITISGDAPALPAIPALVTKMTMKSRSPALAAGTGVDRGIDASLGDAVQKPEVPALDDPALPVVPIDVVPVISMAVPPTATPGITVGGLPGAKIVPAPGVPGPGSPDPGFSERGGEKYRFEIAGLHVERIDPASGAVLAGAVTGSTAPVVWWTLEPTDTQSPTAQLALFTWEPSATTKAIEKTDRLTQSIVDRWGTVCREAARPAEVFYTFRSQPLGASVSGWLLDGTAWPDDDHTQRSSAPFTRVRVHERWRSGFAPLDGQRGVIPAIVTGNPFGPVAVFPDSGQRQATRLPRALEAPMLDDGSITLSGSRELEEAIAQQLDERGVTHGPLDDVTQIDTTGFVSFDVLLFLPRTLLEGERLWVRAVDENDDSLQKHAVNTDDLQIAGAALPERWVRPEGPWAADVTQLMNWQNQTKWVAAIVHLDAAPDARLIEIGTTEVRADEVVEPSYFIAAFSFVGQAEVDRQSWDDYQSSNEKETLTNFLGEPSSDNVLLYPDSLYRVSVDWFAERRSDSAKTGSAAAPETQSFWFRTDRIEAGPVPGAPVVGEPGQALHFTSTPPLPVRLDSWLLMTVPGDREKHVFGGEHVRLVFNTHDVERLLAAYGKEMRLRFQASTGRHPVATPEVGHPFALVSPALEVIGGTLLSPYEGALVEAVNELSVVQPFCIPVDQDRSRHSVVDIPILLDNSTDYIVDVELVDTGAAPDARGPSILRRFLSTGAHSTLADLATSIVGTRPLGRGAEVGAFEGIRAHFAGRRPSGSEFDDQLRSAGVEPLTVPERPRVTVFWAQATPADTPQPVAVLVDATAPLDRRRPYPTKIVDDTAPIAAERWVLDDRVWLTLRDASGAGVVAVDGLVFAPGEQRALIVLAPGARGRRLLVDLVEPAFADLPFIVPGATPERVLDISFDAAPWEEV